MNFAELKMLISRHGIMVKMMVRSIAMISLTLLTVEYISYNMSAEQITQMTVEQQATLSATYAERLDKSIESIESDLVTLASAPAFRDYSKNLHYDLLNEASENLKSAKEYMKELSKRVPSYEQIVFQDKHGKELIRIKDVKLEVTKHLDADKKVSFIGIVSSDKEELLVFESVVEDIDKEQIGKITAFYRLSDMLKGLKNEKIFTTGFLALFNSKMQAIYYPGQKSLINATSIHSELTKLEKNWSNPKEGSYWLNIDKEYMVGSKKLSKVDWMVTAFAAESEMFGVLNKIKKTVLWIVCLNILIEILFLAFFTEIVVLQPIKALLKVTRRIRSGDLSARVEVKNKDEISELGESFNEMTSELQKSMNYSRELNANLESLVESRTHELQVAHATLVTSTKLSALGEMAGGVAHEINNPLAIIKGMSWQISELLRDEKPDFEKVQQNLARIDITIARIAKIVQGLRMFSRDAKKDPMVEFSVKSIIENTTYLCQEKFKSHGVNIEIDAFDPNISINCRGVEISQVLLNLLNNSFDAIEHNAEKWIRISVAEVGAIVEIKVIDSGCGIEKSLLDKIFLPFFTTKDVGRGTGLGLSISAGIISAHGGSLEIDSSSKNTCFVIRLPKV